MVKHTLVYFDATGRAEATRLAFDLGKIPFADTRLSKEQFKDSKDTFPNGQLPMLEVDDRMYCQSNAIFRYAAKIGGLYPQVPIDALRADMVGDQLEDTFGLIGPTFRMDQDEKLKARKILFGEGGKVYNKYKELNDWISGPFVLGHKLTSPDLQLYGFVKFIESGFLDGIPNDYFDVFPKIRGVYDSVNNDPRVIDYYNSK